MTNLSTVTIHRKDDAGVEDLVYLRSYRALKVALNDWRTFSSDTLGFNVVTPQHVTRSFKQYPFELDPPEHTAFRAAIDPFFKRPLTAPYAAEIARQVGAAVDHLLSADHVDVTPGFSLPLQSRTLTTLLAMPEAEADLWVTWGINVFGNLRHGDPPEQERADALVTYVTEQTDNPARYPGSLFDELSRLTIAGRPLSRDERLGVAHISFSGGRETLIALLTGIVALFAREPAAKEAIRRDPALAQSATEELLRVISPLRLLARTCPHGGDAGGVTVAPGQRLGMCYGRANRDPAVFADPDQVRLDRKPNPHLAFGSGPHACLGNAHARLVARTVLVELARRAKRIEILEAAPEAEAAPHDVQGLRFERLVVRAR
ncbi:MAG: cytochrome P450 [Rubellimicrobium sp.]|nr:cytochrome P450 [Rubellimicrobium sp.]